MATKNKCFLETEIRMNERSTWWISAFWTYSDCGCFLIECPVWAIWSFNALREYRLLSALYHMGFLDYVKKYVCSDCEALWWTIIDWSFTILWSLKYTLPQWIMKKTDRTFCKNLRCHHSVFFKGKWLKSTKEALYGESSVPLASNS